MKTKKPKKEPIEIGKIYYVPQLSHSFDVEVNYVVNDGDDIAYLAGFAVEEVGITTEKFEKEIEEMKKEIKRLRECEGMPDMKLYKMGIDVEPISVKKLGFSENRTDKDIRSYIRGYFWRGYRIKIKPPFDEVLMWVLHDTQQAEYDKCFKESDQELADLKKSHQAELEDLKSQIKQLESVNKELYDSLKIKK